MSQLHNTKLKNVSTWHVVFSLIQSNAGDYYANSIESMEKYWNGAIKIQCTHSGFTSGSGFRRLTLVSELHWSRPFCLHCFYCIHKWYRIVCFGCGLWRSCVTAAFMSWVLSDWKFSLGDNPGCEIEVQCGNINSFFSLLRVRKWNRTWLLSGYEPIGASRWQ